MPYMFDSTMVILIPALILSMYAQFKVSSTFSRFSKVGNKRGLTGADVARQLLSLSGVTDVTVERIKGNLTDHYDPRGKVLRLSDSVYGSTSVAALGVAAHETGHAMQHSYGYVPLGLRSAFLPVAGFGSKLSMPLILIGLILGISSGSVGLLLAEIGILLFSAVVIFQIITLPVEFNASNRAIEMLEENKMLDDAELAPAKKVLRAAALTYVAAVAVSLANLLRMMLIVGGRRRD